MAGTANTLFLRLEGPLQAWGDTSKFVIRRTMEAPTKSGILGLICAAMGVRRLDARQHLKDLNKLAMGVRIDRPGARWWDYHTVGAGYGLLKAEGGIKITGTTKTIETLVSRREYLCDASFLVALRGQSETIQHVKTALEDPKWPPFLGRKSCVPSVPIMAGQGNFPGLKEALQYIPWQPRLVEVDGVSPPGELPCLIEWQAPSDDAIAPSDAEVWYDVPISFDPSVHWPRLIVRTSLKVHVDSPTQQHTPPAPRPQAAYEDSVYKQRQAERWQHDQHLCVFCKAPLTPHTRTVQHITYRRAGGGETMDDLRSLCRLCHDAVTMIEYGLGMGLDRINPEEPRWRDEIIKKRKEIIDFRSLETRRRRLSPEEVE
ncbi:MAG: type I-E CRISPR-associated protein Cas5/CasD [Chloroflexi bacterium]|nr:type I-E CRISPR-associated protein Cas5/CasD [Chloroflexota bacterium]